MIASKQIASVFVQSIAQSSINVRAIYCSLLYDAGDRNMLFNVGRGYTVKLDEREVDFVDIYYATNAH